MLQQGYSVLNIQQGYSVLEGLYKSLYMGFSNIHPYYTLDEAFAHFQDMLIDFDRDNARLSMIIDKFSSDPSGLKSYLRTAMLNHLRSLAKKTYREIAVEDPEPESSDEQEWVDAKQSFINLRVEEEKPRFFAFLLAQNKNFRRGLCHHLHRSQDEPDLFLEDKSRNSRDQLLRRNVKPALHEYQRTNQIEDEVFIALLECVTLAWCQKCCAAKVTANT